MRFAPLDPAHRAEAARLYWHASGPQLARILGPRDRAAGLMALALDPAFALAATTDGQLIGLLGYRSHLGTFLNLEDLDLRSYGIGRLWRQAALASVPRRAETALVIDTLAVDPGFRGEGIGTALLEAAASIARAAGHRELRIDVAPANENARALYTRAGFTARKPESMGPLWPLFGTRHRIPMRKSIGAASPPA